MLKYKDSHSSSKAHFSTKVGVHQESPEVMSSFVRNRSAFFTENYKQGQAYRNTSWLNPSWLLTFIDYYLKTFKNNLAGFLSLGITPTHYCEDFDLGYKSTEVSFIDANEVGPSL